MRFTLLIFVFFGAGILGGMSGVVPEAVASDRTAMSALYALLLFVGMGVGSQTAALSNMLRMSGWALLVPLGIALGSLAGAALLGLALPGIGLRESLAVGAGFGYYSLSSVIVSQLHSEALGVIALLANVAREVITILAMPLLARMGNLAPIAAGGATSMDTTLPMISRYVPGEYTVVAVFSGLVLSLLVPLLLPVLL
jgi:uncharacterized membrane protein YbjE (DUF340 family)